MRILIATSAPLSEKFGAGQVALNLGAAFERLGHQVVVWSASPYVEGVVWWKSLWVSRESLDAFLKDQPSFQLIDANVHLVTPTVTKQGLTIVRSTQPELLYLLGNIGYPPGNDFQIRTIVRRIVVCCYSLFLAILELSNWWMADHIFALGSLELQWMTKYFPFWRGKISCYPNTLAESEQVKLRRIRAGRKPSKSRNSIRFLWVGRWHPQKGIYKLLDFIKRRAALCPFDEFTIAGCGTKAEEDCPRDLLRAGRLRLIPEFDRRQLLEILSGHDVGLVTSQVEGWGLMLNEMLESGMVVYATNVGGAPDLAKVFKRTLRSFPPPIEIKFELESSDDLARYYSQYNWDKIAMQYLHDLSLD